MTAGAPPAAPAQQHAAVAWVRVDGEIFAVPDLASLQRWVLEKRVLPDDRCSVDGTTWSAIGDRPELGLFFEAADRLDRSSTSAQHALMTMAHSDAEDVFADPEPGEDDGNLTELASPGADPDEEPIPAGDDSDDDDGPPSTSLSFSVNRVGRVEGAQGPATDGTTMARSVGEAAPGSGTAAVQIAAPALPEGGLAQVYAGWDEAPAADPVAPVPEEAAPPPSTPRLLTPAGARVGLHPHPLPPHLVAARPLPDTPATMPDFRSHPGSAAPAGAASQVDEAGGHVPQPHLTPAHVTPAHAPPAHAPPAHAPPAHAHPAPHTAPLTAPSDRSSTGEGGLSVVAWFVLVVLVAVAIVVALWMHGPVAATTRSAGDPPPISKRLPPGVQPIALPPAATQPTAPQGTPVPSMAPPAVPQPIAPAAPQPITPASPQPIAPVPAASPSKPSAPDAARPTAGAPMAPPSRLTGRAAAQPGWNAVEREQWTTARAAFEQVLATEPGNPWAIYGRAYVAERTGDLATARTAYCSALKRAGTGDLARDLQAGARRVSADCPP